MAMVEANRDPVPVKIERVLVSQQEAVVLLAPGENGDFRGKVLPVFIDIGQAMNIQVSLEGKVMGRPLTHDLFTSVLNELGASVVHVIIEDIAQNTFFATLHLERDKGGKKDKVQFDARPSDCLALAVRSGAQIQVRRKVLEQAAVERDKLLGKGGTRLVPPGEEDIEEEDEDDDEEAEGRPPPKKAPRKGPGEGMDPSEFERP